jgi:carbonic anhydrase/acetyltransferase-like protein (isoleucine patch superfamily)
MATIIELDGVVPTIGEGVFLAPTAVLAGDVRIGDRANVWFGAVLRGDSSHIAIGAECSIQDNAVIHCAHELPTVIGDRVVIGHSALLEGCVIEDEALIGMGAVVLQRAHVGSGAMVAAGAVVSERARVAPKVLVAGVPALEKKKLSGSALDWTRTASAEYQQFSKRYMTAGRVVVTDAARAPGATQGEPSA